MKDGQRGKKKIVHDWKINSQSHLIIHQSKKIISVKEVWLPGLN